MPCVGLFTRLGILGSCVVARVLFWMVTVCRCGRARLSRGCYFRESAPCLARQAIAPVEASLSLLLRGLCSLTRVSSLCCWSVSTSCSVCDHARAHSGVEHTSAVTTGTVRDPCDQPSSSPRATSSRSPCTGSSCSSSSLGVLLHLTARGVTRDQSTRRVPSHPLRSLSFSGLVSADHWFHPQQASSRYAVCSLLVLVVMRDWCWARVWLEQRASPSLLPDHLGALNHSLRRTSDLRLIALFTITTFAILFLHASRSQPSSYSAFSFRASLTSLVDSQHLTCLSHFSLSPDVRALVRRVVELIKITDVACWSERHQLLMVLVILSQLCSDSNRNARLSVFGCSCEHLRSQWSQMASECVGRPTSCCCYATDTLASCALTR